VVFTEEDIETFDVLLLLGGFKLDHLIPESFDKYTQFKELLELNSKDGQISLEQFGDSVSLDITELNQIEANVRNYMAHIEQVIDRLRIK